MGRGRRGRSWDRVGPLRGAWGQKGQRGARVRSEVEVRVFVAFPLFRLAADESLLSLPLHSCMQPSLDGVQAPRAVSGEWGSVEAGWGGATGVEQGTQRAYAELLVCGATSL